MLGRSTTIGEIAKILVVALAALGLVGGCKQAPSPALGVASRADARTPSVGRAASAARGGGVERRGRAGIETGEAPPPPKVATRPPAAVLITPPGPSAPPPVLSGADARAARAAWHFVQARWLPAVRSAKPTRYTMLLADSFNASRIKGAKTVSYDAKTWPTIQHGGLGAPVRITITPPRITLVHDAMGTTATIRFSEHAIGPKACMVVDRELTLTPDLAKPRLRTEVATSRGPCGVAIDTSGVSRAIAAIGAVADKAREERNVDALARHVVERVVVRDSGVTVASYSPKELAMGDGRWVLHLVAETKIAPKMLFALGPIAVVPAKGGPAKGNVRLVFEQQGPRWRLRAILRRAAPSPLASPKVH